MKNRFFLILALLVTPTLSATKAQDICTQVIQAAVSPSGTCQEFANPCIVPEDWKSVPSCDIINSEAESGTSLERKMNSRIAKMRAYWDMKKAEQDENAEPITNKNFNRIGSGAFTRSDRSRRLPTSDSTGSDSTGLRTFTEKDYSSDVAERYSQRGGYERDGETTSAERKERRAYRAPIRSSSEVKRTGDLQSTVKWDVMSRQFTTEKSYGPNPYRVRSQYLADQKAKRDASNQEVDVYERMMSRQRVYRGERKTGNLTEQDLLDLQESRTTEE